MSGRDDQRFRLLLNTLPHAAFLLSATGQAEHYNAAFVAYAGFVPGPSQEDRLALHHPEDRPFLAAARAGVQSGRRDWVLESRMRRHDGAWRWHRVSNRALYDQGIVAGYLGTAVDIHDEREASAALERRVAERTAALAESEARYRKLYNRTPMALHSVDASARLIDVNDTWTEMFGWPREEALGRSPADFMTQASATFYRSVAWPDMLASRGVVRAVEYEFVSRAGRVFEGRLSSAGEFDAQGRFIRSWAATSDISAERRAQRELLQAQRMEAVGQLTAGIAHDFNNLLTAILGSLELMGRETGLSERATRRIAAARGAAARGARLTAQLLAFSRKQAVAAEPVEVNALLERVRSLLESTLGPTVPIAFELADDLPLAHADASQLELAVLNLAINARDAMGGAGPLTIATLVAQRGPPTRPEEPEAGPYVAVSVRDAGPGIPSEVRDRIFEPFFTTKEAGRGSGLGLSQVLGVMKQLGGGVSIHGTEGEGTTVELLLPFAKAAARVEAPGTAAPDGARRSKISLMVVDDDPAVRDTVAELLGEVAHDVTVFGSAAEVLAALERTRPDLLLVDVAMPGMTGLDLEGALTRRWPELPVLFMTGYADGGLLDRAGRPVLRKPFTLSELWEKLSAFG